MSSKPLKIVEKYTSVLIKKKYLLKSCVYAPLVENGLVTNDIFLLSKLKCLEFI
jgi:hypothetical protein